MKSISIDEGTGRTRVSLGAQPIGNDLVVRLFNDFAHLGAVAVADYSAEENRASTSVLTRLGHKDDVVAQRAAHKLCKLLKKPVCVIAGIHLDGITGEEIAEIIRNCDNLVEKLVSEISGQ
jgi:gallate decarboxylase subunit D